MKLTRVFATVLFLFITTSGLTYAGSSLKQVRNSLWSFGVSNSLTTEVEMIQEEIPHISGQLTEFGHSATRSAEEVPEELDMAIAKFES